MDNEIVANTERIDEVVKNFSEQLNQYVENMKAELRLMQSSLSNLGTGWVSDDFKKFSDSMELKIGKINHELERSQKLKAYLDNVSLELREFLNTLKEAAED